MILMTLKIMAPPQSRNEILRTLNSVLGPTQSEPGCLTCKMYQDIENAAVLTLVEEWDSQSDLDRYLQSEDFRKILAVMDMSSQHPEITFNTISETTGMEAIIAVRG